MFSQELVTSSCEQITRVGILERHFYLMFLDINSSLRRLEFCLVFYPRFSLLQNAIHE